MYKTYIETKHENRDCLGPSEMGYEVLMVSYCGQSMSVVERPIDSKLAREHRGDL